MLLNFLTTCSTRVNDGNIVARRIYQSVAGVFSVLHIPNNRMTKRQSHHNDKLINFLSFPAICHPLHLYAMSGFKRAVRIIAALWVISFLSAVPFGVYSKIDYIYYPPGKWTIHISISCTHTHDVVTDDVCYLSPEQH